LTLEDTILYIAESEREKANVSESRYKSQEVQTLAAVMAQHF